MKKLLLASAAVAALSSSAFAADDSIFYLRGDAGFDMFNNVSTGQKLKAKYTGDISAGVGYKVMDNLRAELAYAYFFQPTRKGSGATTLADVGTTTTNITDIRSGAVTVATGAAAGDATATASLKTKANIQTLMLKGYYDVADLGMAKLFVAAGIGAARVQEKVSVSYSGVTAGTTVTATAADSASNSSKLKSKNNFSWLLGVGAGFEVTDAVTIDVQYNFQDFGKTSSASGAKVKGGKCAYRAHALKAGVRFDI